MPRVTERAAAPAAGKRQRHMLDRTHGRGTPVPHTGATYTAAPPHMHAGMRCMRAAGHYYSFAHRKDRRRAHVLQTVLYLTVFCASLHAPGSRSQLPAAPALTAWAAHPRTRAAAPRLAARASRRGWRGRSATHELGPPAVEWVVGKLFSGMRYQYYARRWQRCQPPKGCGNWCFSVQQAVQQQQHLRAAGKVG